MTWSDNFTTLFEDLPIGAYRTDAGSRQVRANRAMVRIFGFESEAEMLATEKSRAEGWYVLPGRRAEFRRLLEENGLVRNFVSEMRRHTNETFWISENAHLVRDASGTVLYHEGTVEDITARVLAQQALQITLDNAGRGIARIDANNRIVLHNQRFLELLDIPASVMAAQPTIEELVRFQKERGDFAHEQGLEDSTGPVAFNFHADTFIADPMLACDRYLRRTHNGLVLEVQTQHLREGGMVRTYSDVTSYVEAQQQLAQKQSQLIAAKDAAEAAERVKADFLANMSHEIRTPMNAVIGMGELLLQTPLDPRQREFAETIRNSSDSLLTLINDILDFSKIESGNLVLEHVPVDLALCVEGALDLVAGPAAAKGLDLVYAIAEGVPQAVLGDPTRLRQVIVNLVSNAVKFTQRGEVAVTLAVRSEVPGIPALHVSVRDTGIGVPMDRRDRLFQAFSQVDASTTREFGGTGLGLAICRRLVSLMGGRIWVESVEGRGSNFQFEVPFAAVAAPSPAMLPAFAGERVLVVDDNTASREMLVQRLRGMGLRAEGAATAAAALAGISSGQAFEAAVVDAQMPGMDGWSLAVALQSRGVELPVLMLTALGAAEVVRPPNVWRCVTKPVKAQALRESLAALLQGTPSHAMPAHAHRSGRPALLAAELPLRVLLAEDNLINQRVATLILQTLGYEAVVVQNGQQMLDAVGAALTGGAPFDAVFLDVQMPVLDGLAASRLLHERHPQAAQRPWIIAMTAKAMHGDREECMAAGMDDYVSKPIRANAVADALRRAAAGIAARGQPVPAPLSCDGDDLLAGMDPSARSELESLFAQEAPRLRDEINRATDRGDVEGVAIAAHTLAGTASYFSAHALVGLCRRIEDVAGEGHIGEVRLWLAELDAAVDEAVRLPRRAGSA